MKKITLFFIIIIEVIMIGTVYSKSITEDLSSGLLRLHILANSDNRLDQNIKIQVRDYIIKHINNNFDKKEDVINSVKDLEVSIDRYLSEIGADYKCDVIFSLSEFNTKKYSNISVPAGEYESLKVVLGEGRGKNWWCVAYPPLCFTESVAGKISEKGEKELVDKLNVESYNIIKNDNKEYKIKFKIVEILGNLF